MKISGCIILYNPDKNVIENINSYINYIDKLFVFDNSEIPNLSLIDQILDINTKIIYLGQKENLGIAKALNICSDISIKENFDWLLTMDQDSKFIKIKDLATIINPLPENTGMIASSILKKHNDSHSKFIDIYTNIDWALTSGSLLNLKIYQKIGSFLNELFIDEVDYEYCLRMKYNNYSVITCEELVLEHNLGDITNHRFLFMNFRTSNHSATRKYYIVRNRMYVSLLYKNIFPNIAKGKIIANIKDSIKVLLFEQNKISKIYHIFLGYLDYKRNRLGKFNSHT